MARFAAIMLAKALLIVTFANPASAAGVSNHTVADHAQRQLHGASASSSIAQWRGEALGLLRRAETEALLLTALLPVVVVRLVARVTTTGRGHAARQPASRPELATDARVAARDRQVVHLAPPAAALRFARARASWWRLWGVIKRTRPTSHGRRL